MHAGRDDVLSLLTSPPPPPKARRQPEVDKLLQSILGATKLK